ncbi:hypothetical protein [Burkholderia sola]|uniref:hypothetical protein n=1 Tax=Burkholderia sola TaxID=2843302 RepID=UPI0023DDC6A2|nr:hypothetical protein [Burkholderia sola]MDF3084756.1 hypothetical protein [Burkholderia sola]
MNRLKIRDLRMNLFLESAGKVRSFNDYAVDLRRTPGRAATQLAAAWFRRHRARGGTHPDDRRRTA